MSSRFIQFPLKLASAALVISVLFAGAATAAQKVPATVRVVTSAGKILVDKKIRTGTESVRTSKSAECFGPGSSNGSTKIAGPTALGILNQASGFVPALRPLSVTNASEFGLGVCGIGGFVSKPSGFWLLKHNHADSSLGGEATVLEKNDVTLWYLVDDFNQPTPDELFLQAPNKVRKGKNARVRVLAHDSKGRRNPVASAKLSGFGARTDSAGFAHIKISRKTRIVARFDGKIPSNRVQIGIRK